MQTCKKKSGLGQILLSTVDLSLYEVNVLQVNTLLPQVTKQNVCMWYTQTESEREHVFPLVFSSNSADESELLIV